MELYEGEPIPNFEEYFHKGIAEYFVARDFNNKDAVYCLKCRRAFPNMKDHAIHKSYLKANYYKYDKQIFDKLQADIKDLEESAQKDKSVFIGKVDGTIEKFIENLRQVQSAIKAKYEEQFNFLTNVLEELYALIENTKNGVKDYYELNQPFYDVLGKNQDKENSIFLMHFDMMQDFMKENKNYKNILDAIRGEIKNNPGKIEKELDNKLEEIQNALKLNFPADYLDNFYVKPFDKMEKYHNHNKDFIKTLVNIQNSKGNLKKINDLVKIFDSKTIRGVDFLYSQPYFLEGINVKPKVVQSQGPKTNAIHLNSPLSSPSKSSLSQRGTSSEKNLTSGRSSNRLSTAKKNWKIINDMDDLNNEEYALGKGDGKKITEEDVNLAKEFLQRYYSYSVRNFYVQNFAPKKDQDFMKNSKYLLLDYEKRQAMLKEYKKPIVGTNILSVYNPKTNTRTQIELPLNQNDHGYAAFPEGCRAICIEDIVYITGGKDKLGNPLNYMNMFDLRRKELKPLPHMLAPHAFHNIDYLFNYECIIVAGGDDFNCNVEMYDIATKKWNLLPPFNYPRVNPNLIYDSIGATVHLLFGVNENDNSQVIEVLPLTDLKKGWLILNYAKNAFLDVHLNYCKVKQFSLKKFLIYGANQNKQKARSYAFYLLDKNEIVRVVNPDDIQEIKRYERLKLGDNLNSPSTSKILVSATERSSRQLSYHNSQTSKKPRRLFSPPTSSSIKRNFLDDYPNSKSSANPAAKK